MAICRLVHVVTALGSITAAAAGGSGPGMAQPPADPFHDPSAYCASVGTLDQPDVRYRGPAATESMAAAFGKSLSETTLAQPDGQLGPGLTWRCDGGFVLVCDRSDRADACVSAVDDPTLATATAKFDAAEWQALMPAPGPPLSVTSPNPTEAEWAALVQQDAQRFFTQGIDFAVGRLDVVAGPQTLAGEITPTDVADIGRLERLGLVELLDLTPPNASLRDASGNPILKQIESVPTFAGRRMLAAPGVLQLRAGAFAVTAIRRTEVTTDATLTYHAMETSALLATAIAYRRFNALKGTTVPILEDVTFRATFRFDPARRRWDLVRVDHVAVEPDPATDGTGVR